MNTHRLYFGSSSNGPKAQSESLAKVNWRNWNLIIYSSWWRRRHVVVLFFFFHAPKNVQKNASIKRTALFLMGCLICVDSSHAYLESACQFVITLQKTNSNNVFRGQILKYSYFPRCTQSIQPLYPLFGGQATLGVKPQPPEKWTHGLTFSLK